MTIRQALKQSIECLELHKLSSPVLDVEILSSFVLSKDKAFLYTHPEKNLTTKQKGKLHLLITRRAHGYPIAYLTGHKEFFGLDFKITKDVLVPRPETEVLVESVIEKIKDLRLRIKDRPISILDVGAGSGCIIISLTKNLQPSTFSFYASDISKKALDVAKQNAKKHGVRIQFKKGPLMEPWQKESFDIIAANLPYGWKEWKNQSSADTKGLKFEPRVSLFTGKKGLELYDKFFRQIKDEFKPMLIAVEFDPRQTAALKKLAKKYLPQGRLKIIKDLSGKNRVLQITL